ncbi:uncharacterized protein N7459_003300 [Penicillium hispanicum]|uniref:uncharacterized protein n=1 Tax=Penicillium hispanicum TaxID=1080232 RepID=UPI00254186CD|nr:uncharacterized protein N7459_003300 [Penicillium hispanicum]KAJ5587535.1 hypothetical protein N7459_003300 [Penicillium hispanicum]
MMPVDEVPANAPVMTFDRVDKTRTAPSESSSKPPAKRNRIQLSCTQCRQAKLKCDRERPCSQCIKKGRASICIFKPPVARKRPTTSMQNRLEHLESLVKGAMASLPSNGHDGSASNSLTFSPDSASQLQAPTDIRGTSVETPIYAEDGVSNASGQVILGPNETTYVGATHWAAMLDDIEQVKTYFNEVEGEASLPDESVRSGLSLFFDPESLTTKEDLLAALPERPIVNRLIYRYFNSNSPALHVIHKPTFQNNYRKFWSDPHGSPISWLALIYSIMGLAIFAALGAGEENADLRGTPIEMIRTYRGCCAQCLVLSNNAQPGPYTLEAFLIYIEVAVAVRLALRMGLHRDSDNVGGNITPYQGEIRRRIWHLLVQMDLLASFHNGLPPMVQAIESDTRVPLNLKDEDFDEDTTELPASRPETEITGMSYTLAKGRIARVFGKIIEQANLLTLPPYHEVTALDQELRQAFAAVPPFLRVAPMELSITESPQLIVQRFSIAVLFHKSQCVLHRKYLMNKKDNAEFSHSKKAGIDASMELLSIQSEVHDAVQPGGPLCKDLWFVSSLSMHDLLLAAMIVYSSLMQESEGIALKPGDLQEPNTKQTQMIRALQRSYRIWTETTSMSVDIGKACGVLGNMVKRVNSVFRHYIEDTVVSAGSNDAAGCNDGESILRLSLNEPIPSPELPTSVFDLLSGGHYQGSDDTFLSPGLAMQSDFDAMSMPMDPLGAFLDTSMEFDWNVFDNHVRQPPVNDRA